MNNLHLVNLEFKGFTEYEGKVIGYGAYYNNIDKVDDIILPGAFAESVQQHREGKKSIPLLEEHKKHLVWVDNIQNLYEDENGLKIEAIVPEEKKSEFGRITNKAGLSIGYFVRQSHNVFLGGKNVRMIAKADLSEISVVDYPANSKAVAEFKSYDTKEFRAKIDNLFEERKSKKSLQDGIEILLKKQEQDYLNGIKTTGSQKTYIAEKIISLATNVVSLELKSAENYQSQAQECADTKSNANAFTSENPCSGKVKIIFDKQKFNELII